MATTAKWIVFLGETFPGREHDYTMLKTEFPPDHPWFEHIRVLLDLAYQGIQSDYQVTTSKYRIKSLAKAGKIRNRH
jgi:hypothetical protein